MTLSRTWISPIYRKRRTLRLAMALSSPFGPTRLEVARSKAAWCSCTALRIYVVDYQAESGIAVGIALREFFFPENLPASTWIGVSALADPEFLIEIEATAVLD